jgi:hypothetical protein
MTGTGSLPTGSASLWPDEPISISHGEDSAVASVALTLFAIALGHAVDLKDGTYSPEALFWLTVGVGFVVLAVINPRWEGLQPWCRRWLPMILAVGVADQSYYLLSQFQSDPHITLAFMSVAILGVIQFFNIRSGLKWALTAVMVLSFCIAGVIAFNIHSKYPGIDVFMFQSGAAHGFVHGMNPYTLAYPNIYPPDTPFYGAGVVNAAGPLPPGFIDFWHRALPEIIYPSGLYPIGWNPQYQTIIGASGTLTVGYPYPPLSMILTLPGYLLGGDVRYSHVAAMGISAGLIATTRPGRVASLAAALLLLMPRALYVLDLSWTEPLLVLTFSFVMFCAFRWRKALPIALGLYFSTKQYTILTLPLLPLLIGGPHHWRSLGKILLKAAVVVALINIPFLLWDFHGFVRSLVVFQLLQSFRMDALSYLVFIRQYVPSMPVPAWIALLPLVVIIPLSLRRLPNSPAGFCAAVTAVHLFFFAFNKQAFCNYYYFVIATACWAVAVGRFPAPSQTEARGFEVVAVR